ncbi:MAG: hypothetical protein HQL80_02935 [Magnetococcales bacterium]|nr:hypothetical protein [Magnetococcales bacterium]
MDRLNVIEQLDGAIAEARGWAEVGWPMHFGRNSVRVSSLSEAQGQPNAFVYRQEAIAYWKQVAELGQETAEQGEKAKQALAQQDLRLAEGAVYWAAYMEKKLNKPVPTWEPLLATLRSLV